jgi:hypothetical protein
LVQSGAAVKDKPRRKKINSRVSVGFSQETYAFLQEISAQRDVSVALVVRDAVAHYRKTHRSRTTPAKPAQNEET